jgi:hypothetical protein
MTLEFAETEAQRRTNVLKTTQYVIRSLFDAASYMVSTRVPRGQSSVHTYFADGSELET